MARKKLMPRREKRGDGTKHHRYRRETPPDTGPESLTAILARLDERLIELGLSDRHASVMCGRSLGFIRSIRKQHRTGAQKGIQRPNMLLLANTLKVNPLWFARGEGPKLADEAGEEAFRQTIERERDVIPSGDTHDDNGHEDLIERAEPRVSFAKMTGPLRRGRHKNGDSKVTATVIRDPAARGSGLLKVTEKIAAGAWFEGSAADGAFAAVDVPADPRYPVEQQIAVVVDDTSANRIASPGEFLVVDTKRQPNANDVALVSRSRSNLREVTARRYLPTDDSIELRCESNDQRHQGSITVKNNMRASDGSVVKIEGVVVSVYRPMM